MWTISLQCWCCQRKLLCHLHLGKVHKIEVFINSTAMLDNKSTTGLKSYCAQARAFREQEAMRTHRKNLLRSETRGREQHQRHDVDLRWNEHPALLKDRLGRPASAVGLTPQTHTRALVRADKKVRPHSQLAKRLGGSEDLVLEMGGNSTPLARLRPPTGPPSLLARIQDLEQMRESGAPVRQGYTNRERAVLWGTSLANYQAVLGVTDWELDSASCVRRRRRRAGGTGGAADVQAADAESNFEYAKKAQVARVKGLPCSDQALHNHKYLYKYT
jgi:hypothetical protein